MLKLGPELFERLNAGQSVGGQTPAIYGKGGLANRDLRAIEEQLGFLLPEDFQYFLKNMRDPGGIFFPWERFDTQSYAERIDWVWEGVAFDIDANKFWMERWGKRPPELTEAIAIAKRDFPNWPKLLPIFAHRFLAAEPCLPDNPVFSIMQTDIICYGANLAHYLVNEFLSQDFAWHTYEQAPRHIAIWSDF